MYLSAKVILLCSSSIINQLFNEKITLESSFWDITYASLPRFFHPIKNKTRGSVSHDLPAGFLLVVRPSLDRSYNLIDLNARD